MCDGFERFATVHDGDVQTMKPCDCFGNDYRGSSNAMATSGQVKGFACFVQLMQPM